MNVAAGGQERRSSIRSQRCQNPLLYSRQSSRRSIRKTVDINGCTKIPITRAILESDKNMSNVNYGSRRSMTQFIGTDGVDLGLGSAARQVSNPVPEQPNGAQTSRVSTFGL